MNDKPYKDNDKTTLNLNQYREEKAKKKMENRVYDTLDKIREHSKFAHKNFLEAWKKGVKLRYPLLRSKNTDG